VTPDLRTTYLGLALSSPLVASASPLTGRLDSLRALEEAGAAAVVLPSLFEEQLEHEEVELDALLEHGTHSFGEALTYFPELEDYNTGPGSYVELVAEAKRTLSIPVIASLNGSSPGGWIRYATLLEQAGADALELNVYAVEADAAATAAGVEERTLELVRSVRAAVALPLAVKVGPFYTAFAHMAGELAAAGADGLVLFNRFLQPDLDLETLAVTPALRLSTSDELRLPLRWIAILRGHVAAGLAATGGAHTTTDVVKLLLAGADVVELASALLLHGPGHLGVLQAGLEEWLREREYDSVSQLRGSLSRATAPDPAAFERAQYVQALVSFAPGAAGRSPAPR
jgi:dihydroorotate dehydrogenase (fumarate)